MLLLIFGINYNNLFLFLYICIMFILGLFVLFILGGWGIGKFLGNLLFPEYDNIKTPTYIDNSTHTHFHVHTKDKSKEIKELGDYVDENFNAL